MTRSLLMLLLLTRCTALSELRLQSKADVAIPNETRIKFRYIKKLVVVDGFVNGSTSPTSYIFDTGAFQSKIEYDLSDSLQLQTVSERNNSTAQGIERRIEIVLIDSIRFGNATYSGIAAGKLKYDPKSLSPCVAKDGIIGSNLIKKAYWKFDYESRELVMSESPIESNRSRNRVLLDFNTSLLSGVPLIDIMIGDVIIKDVIFDLGYNGGLIIPMKYAKSFNNVESTILYDQSTAGIFGTNTDTVLVKNLEVDLGGIKTNMPVEFSSLNKALLGNDFLEHFTIYLDFKSKQIWLEPNGGVDINEPRNFIPGILNDTLWSVNRTSSKSNLKLGDTLSRINGYKPKELFKDRCDHFFGIGNLLEADTLSVKTIHGEPLQLLRTDL